MTAGFQLPGDGQRSFVCGMTGSGKTRAAAWQLSLRSYPRMPWLVFDFKRDDFIEQIPRLEEIKPNAAPPRHPGLYVVRPTPGEDMDPLLWACWNKGRIGLWFDEGYMIGGAKRPSAAFDAIMTQGRSKVIPCITLAQRPAWLSPFVLSESDYFQAFHLNVKADQVRIRDFTNPRINDDVPRWWSHWYDVSQRFYTLLKPVPNDDVILNTFYDRLTPARRAI